MTNKPPKPPGTPDVDLTDFGNSGTVNDAVFTTGLNHLGIFNPFLQIKHNGTEQGYNTNSTHEQFNEGESKLFNHALLLANVPIVVGDGTRGTVEGVVYRQFLLNISEADGSKQFLSLDKLQIWQEETGSLGSFSSGLGFAGAHTNYLAYDLDAGGDHWIGLRDDLNHPLAQTDFEVLIPDSMFVNDTAHRYVYLYSGFGYHNGWTADGGFEEWGVSSLFLPGFTSAINLKKTASVPGGTVDHAGEVITYSFEVYNVGDHKLTGVTLTDASVSDLTRNADIVGDNDNLLEEGETWSYTAHHTVTQAEIDSNGGGTGTIVNTATVDSHETGPVSASTSVEIVPSAHATLQKLASVPGGTADTAGELITYTMLLTNDGVTSLTNPQMSDTMVVSSTPVIDTNAPIVNHNVQFFVTVLDGDFNLGDTNQNGVWDAGETFQFVYPGDISMDGFHDPGEVWHAINLGDTNNDGIHQVGEVWAGDANQNGVEEAGERWQFKNLGDTNGNHLQDAGEHWQYLNAGDNNQNGVEDPGETFFFANIGDTNQNGVENAGETFQFANAGDTNRNGVEDPGETFQFNVSHVVPGVDANNDGFNDGDTNHDGVFNIGETWQFSFTHAVTQDDIDNGGIVDPALTIDNTATGSTDQANPIASDSASVAVEQRPHVVMAKDATVPGGTANVAGEVIDYTIAITNDGNMTLTSPVVSDPFVSNLAAVVSGGFNTGDTDHDGKVDIGETWHYTANHTVTQAEIDAGTAIANTASVTTGQGASASDGATVTVVQNPHLTLEKNGAWVDGDSDGLADVGESVQYTFTLANDGNVTLHGVTLADPQVTGITRGADIVGNNDAIFNVGEVWSYTGSHAVNQADIDAGNVHNIATAAALGPQNQAASDTDDNDAALPQNAHLVLDKTGAWVDGDADGFADVGESVQYAFTVTNDGNVTLHGVTLTDPQVTGITRGTDIVGNNDAIFNVGEVWSYTGSHAVDQADIDAGTVHNTATAAALGPQSQAASDTDDNDAALPQNVQVGLSKSGTWDDADANGFADAGEQVHYTFLVTNDGNVSLHAIDLNDSLLGGPLSGPASGDSVNPGILDVGETWTFEADYVLLQADVDAGTVHNDATVAASGPQAQTANASASADVALPQAPAAFMSLDISDLVGTHLVDSNENGVGDAGDLIQFSIVLDNLSNDTLTNLMVSDLLGDAVTGNYQTPVPASLAPNGTPGDAWSSSYNHFLTAADIAAGHVFDELTVNALDAHGNLQTVSAHFDQHFPII